MKVKKLRKLLKSADPNAIVVLSIDPEGNGYSPARNHASMVYKDREVGETILTDELRKQGYTDADIMTNGRPCFVLWPA